MSNKYAIEISDAKGAITCDNLLHPYRQERETLTPDFCFDFLKMTNNRKNIREMLKLVAKELEKNPQSYPEYCGVLYGVINNRDQPAEILDRTAELVLKYTNLANVNKLDRAFITDLHKSEISSPLKGQIEVLAEKIYNKVPVDVNDIAENMVKEIIGAKPNKADIEKTAEMLAAYALSEIPEKSKKSNIFTQIFQKMKAR